MRLSMRVAASGFLVLIVSMATAITPLAAGGGPGPGPGGNLAAGSYHFTNQRADFIVSGTYPDPSIALFVNVTNQVSKPEGGPETTTSETDVSINISSSAGYAYGCIVLSNPSDFKLGSGLAGASLHTTITSASLGCFGSTFLLPIPLTIDATWTGTGALATSRDSSEFKCGDYSSESRMVDMSDNATVTASLTPAFANPFSVTALGSAGFGSQDQRIEAEGVSPATCPPAFGGKGAGPGPQSPGSYHLVNVSDGASFTSSAGDLINLFVSDNSETAKPKGGPTTTTHEIDLFVDVLGANTKEFGCFVIPSSDFGFTGVKSAEVRTTITNTTPQCFGPGSGNLPMPMTVSLKLTGTGPTSKLHDEGSFSCLGFSTEAQATNSGNNANATATLTPLYTETLTSTQGSLSTGDQRLYFNGVDPQACIFRG